ncbi:MAG TPA: cytochrome c [Dongiaceae bacterium]|nr:cytochrome c [Dongiaceae bacterium]HXR39389.1 cytochrome c [Terracidiphilus sp.]
MLKPFLVLSAAVLFLIAPTPNPTLASGRTAQDAPPPSTNPVKPTAASQEKAKKLYAIDCAVCHGDNGNGKTDLATSMGVTLADWTDPKALANMPDQQLFDIIRKGKDKMPAEDAGRAKNDEIWGLITYIRGMSKGQPAAPPAAPADATKPGN